MSITQCEICNCTFYVKQSYLNLGWYKCCSTKCRTIKQKKGDFFKCFVCNKGIYRSPLQIKRSKSKKFFCSKSCQTEWRNKFFIEEKHVNWKGGIRSYRNILKRTDKKQICFNCNISNKKLLIVHHIDHNRDNNSKDNLMWLCHNCHHLVHNDLNFELELKKRV